MTRFAYLGSICLLALPLAARAADVNTPINDFIDGFNQGDTKRGFGAYAPGDVIIIDEFAPHIWTGAHAAQDWAADYEKHTKAFQVTDPSVAHQAPTRVQITGDAAYVLVPAQYIYKQAGKPQTEQAQFTFVLKMVDGAWKIASWTYAGEAPK